MNPQKIIFWYLRVNGFLLLEEVNIHGDTKGEVRTDVDWLGVRLKHRQEHILAKFEDDDWIPRDKSVVLFVEAKTGQNTFNRSWRKQEVVESFVRFVGASPREEWLQVTRHLVDQGRAETSEWVYQFAVVSDGRFPLNTALPHAIELKLENLVRFIFRRYKKYERFKHNHPTWPTIGKELFDAYRRVRTEDEFVAIVRSLDDNVMSPARLQ